MIIIFQILPKITFLNKLLSTKNLFLSDSVSFSLINYLSVIKCYWKTDFWVSLCDHWNNLVFKVCSERLSFVFCFIFVFLVKQKCFERCLKSVILWDLWISILYSEYQIFVKKLKERKIEESTKFWKNNSIESKKIK